jgi:cobalt-precorrin-5B (C1)-methyltransferase
VEKKAKGTRKGYTTGACSAAAAKAATLGLINGLVPKTVECDLPNGQKVMFEIADSGFMEQQLMRLLLKMQVMIPM